MKSVNILNHLDTTPRTPGETIGFAMWPENPNWSFQFQRLAVQAYTQGTDFAEFYLALRHVKAGDVEAWYQALNALAAKLEKEADQAFNEGHKITAREKWLRANNYYRASGFFYNITDERGGRAVEGRRRCFKKFASLSDVPIIPVEIPYEDTTLPGYIFSPVGNVKKLTPAVIMMGGGDTVAEEMYLNVGHALAIRGFTCLSFDGPGQGEALRRGLVARYDWEVPIRACIDFLEKNDDVDSKRIAVCSLSLGGYYAGRAAAFEHRLAACIIWGGVYSFPPIVSHNPKADWVGPLKTLFGAESLEEVQEKVKAYTLKGIAKNIECPTLILHGEAEEAFMHRQNET